MNFQHISILDICGFKKKDSIEVSMEEYLMLISIKIISIHQKINT